MIYTVLIISDERPVTCRTLVTVWFWQSHSFIFFVGPVPVSMSENKTSITKHRLLIFDRISRRMRWRLAPLFIVMLLVGIYDQFTSYLGPLWFGWWLAIFLVGLIYFYYAILMRRASIQVRQDSLRLQGPIIGFNISYVRINSVTSANMEQHYSKDQLSRNERSLLKPFYYQTCMFIDLSSYPRRFKRRRLYFPRILFGTQHTGLICHVEDWMGLSQEIEQARSQR